MKDKVNAWVMQVMKYPVMEIYGGKDLTKSKEEKRVESQCENIFKLTASKPDERLPKADLSATYRELFVTLKMAESIPVKKEFIDKKKEEFLTSAKEIINLMEETYKREPVLKTYYESWKIKFQDMKELVYKL